MAHADSSGPQPTAAGELPTEIPLHEVERPTLGRVPTVAGGIPAITSSMRHALGQAGLLRGTRELLLLNQKRGFEAAEKETPGSVLDAQFIADKTTGFAEFANAIEQVSSHGGYL